MAREGPTQAKNAIHARQEPPPNGRRETVFWPPPWLKWLEHILWLIVLGPRCALQALLCLLQAIIDWFSEGL